MHSLEDGFVCGVQFSKLQQIQNVAKCKYLFPSILHNNVMLKTDIMLDYW